MKLKEICSYLDSAIPLSFQEDYDNAGLQAGSYDSDIFSALITLDVTEEILHEAEQKGCNLIISHHPLIFKGLKSITGKTFTERILRDALKKDIAIYSAHTNLDAMENGVSRKMAEKLELQNTVVMIPLENRLLKLVTFIPDSHIEAVSNAIFEAGAGVIGNYDQCGFTSNGKGRFRGSEGSNPYVGEIGKVHFEKETRFETILFSHKKSQVIKALLDSHPYEEPAYDIYRLENNNIQFGFGFTGSLAEELEEKDFLNRVSSVFSAKGLRFSPLTGRKIKKVAVCGGSGSGFFHDALISGADAYITADIKYHSFFEADNRLLLVDVGHYESEKFATEIIYDLITKKFPKFAVRFSEVNTNPINYL